MASELGPAKISVKLDLKTLRSQIAAAKEAVKSVGNIQIKQTDKLSDRIKVSENRVAIAEARAIERIERASRRLARLRGGKKKKKKKKPGIMSRISMIADAVMIGGDMLETGSHIMGKSIKDILGTFGGDMNPLVKQALQIYSAAQEEFSKMLTDAMAYIQAILPSAKQVNDYASAKYLLGDEMSKDQVWEMGAMFYDANYTIKANERTKDKMARQQTFGWLQEMISGYVKRGM